MNPAKAATPQSDNQFSGGITGTAAQVAFALREEVLRMNADIAIAQQLPAESRAVEVDPAVIALFQPQGIGPDGYFWYQNVRVYEKGRMPKAGA